jgi:3-oxoacyl-[acyl-carrier-protein] synthase-1
LQREDDRLPPHRWDGQTDPGLPVLTGIATTKLGKKLTAAMSNSFAFGGNNASLILVRE